MPRGARLSEVRRCSLTGAWWPEKAMQRSDFGFFWIGPEVEKSWKNIPHPMTQWPRYGNITSKAFFRFTNWTKNEKGDYEQTDWPAQVFPQQRYHANGFEKLEMVADFGQFFVDHQGTARWMLEMDSLVLLGSRYQPLLDQIQIWNRASKASAKLWRS